MQGFISGITALKNEDIIVQIITSRRNLTLYRFYGLRHSIINVGRKIDFEIEYSGSFMPKLRKIIQLGYTWESDYNRLHHWQQFMKILSKHLRDTDELPPFYFELLNKGATWLQKQNPSRLFIDIYAQILEFEGRSNTKDTCFVCEKALDDEIVVVRGFLCTHKHCVIENLYTIDKEKFFHFLRTKQSISLDNADVDYLFQILMLGI